jgi:hypothetical protein
VIDMTTDYPGKVKPGRTEQEVDAATLGEFFGITAHAVRILATKEIAIRSGRDRFLLQPSVKNYCGSLRELAKVRSGVGDDSQTRLNTEAAALKRATRELVELRRDAIARKLISIEDITDAGAYRPHNPRHGTFSPRPLSGCLAASEFPGLRDTQSRYPRSLDGGCRDRAGYAAAS